MTKPERHKTPIGVLGLGDLGRRLVAQLLCSDYEVIASDPALTAMDNVTLGEAVDPALHADRSRNKLFRLASIDEVLNTCTVIHWAVPSQKLSELPKLPQHCTVILHDSVMTSSKTAITHRNDRKQFAIAHCLMNDAKRVLVNTDLGNHEAITEHFKQIGLSPKHTTTQAHDALMARTQGIFALLIKLGIRGELDRAFEAGDLTPSAIELRSAVINREANWTAQTLRSILSNPALEPFVKEMSDVRLRQDSVSAPNEQSRGSNTQSS